MINTIIDRDTIIRNKLFITFWFIQNYNYT